MESILDKVCLLIYVVAAVNTPSACNLQAGDKIAADSHRMKKATMQQTIPLLHKLHGMDYSFALSTDQSRYIQNSTNPDPTGARDNLELWDMKSMGPTKDIRSLALHRT